MLHATTVQPVTVGPILGAVTPDAARIFGRGNEKKQCVGVARIRREGETSYNEANSFQMSPNFDWTGVVVFPKLEEVTKYDYQIGWVEMSEQDGGTLPVVMSKLDWSKIDTHSFRTASANRQQKRSFVFGSCRYLLKVFGLNVFDNRGDKTFRSIGHQIDEGVETDALLMLGDQIYADDLNFISPDSKLPQFFARYREHFTQDHLRALMSRVPTYMTLDDHEIEDNWPAKATSKDMQTLYPAAIHSYLTYQVSHSPLFDLTPDGNHISGVPTKLWYTFQDGCCDFFMTDLRTERKLEDPEKLKMMSNDQITALKAWLSDGAEAVKFVGSSTPMFPDAEKPSEDTWSGFLDQRNELLDFIRDNEIPRVVFLSGDVHCAVSAKLTSVTVPDFQVLSLISSAFYWPYPNSWEPQLEGSLFGGSDYLVEGTSTVVRDDNFSRVTVTLEDLTVEVFDRKGKSLTKTTLPFRASRKRLRAGAHFAVR